MCPYPSKASKAQSKAWDFPSWWVSRTSDQLLKEFKSARQILGLRVLRPANIPPPVPTGDKALDELIGGGYGSLTELVGEAGSGKTQFCLSAIASCFDDEVQLAIRHDDASKISSTLQPILVFSTEGPFPTDRLYGILHARFDRFVDSARPHRPPSSTVKAAVIKSCLERVLVERIHENEGLWDSLCHRFPEFVANLGVRMVVVDSVGALFKVDASELANTDDEARMKVFWTRTKQLTYLCALWLRIAEESQVPVIVTNHVTAQFNQDQEPAQAKAALGQAWSAMIVRRIGLQRRMLSDGSFKRTLTIERHPHVGPYTSPYEIDDRGIQLCQINQVYRTDEHLKL